MTATEPRVASTLDLLDTERAALLAIVSRIPESERATRPAPDRWSPNEVIEHLAIVERSVVKLLVLRGHEPPPAEPPPPGTSIDGHIARLRSRTETIEAPERIHPRGALDSAGVLQKLEESRASLKEAFLAADPASLDGCTHPHPILGTLTLRAWVDFVAHHEARHAAQIVEGLGGRAV